MRVHVLQHVPFEGLGALEPWLAARGAAIGWTRLFADPAIPGPDAYDWLIAMGGPMSVNDEVALPWLRGEKRAIAAAIDAGKTVLGVCLGAQLIASACGAKVFANREREIGWWPIERVAGAETHPIGRALPERGEVFHWHGETFDLPRGAVPLARSAGCAAQAFALGDRVVGLQFHLETTRESARAGGELPGRPRAGALRAERGGDPARRSALRRARTRPRAGRSDAGELGLAAARGG